VSIDGWVPELVALRRDLHAHPEAACQEQRTGGIVARSLRLLHPTPALRSTAS
jgi:metal-dependent amidase/aminoacylase/carboxypeptidase family protein